MDASLPRPTFQIKREILDTAGKLEICIVCASLGKITMLVYGKIAVLLEGNSC